MHKLSERNAIILCWDIHATFTDPLFLMDKSSKERCIRVHQFYDDLLRDQQNK
jgi:hypothetical protein